jgi:sec-independent protein translocase protein TatC
MATAQHLAGRRRYFFVGAFVLAAITAPPEVLPQLAVALPLLALYEAAIALFRWLEGRE